MRDGECLIEEGEPVDGPMTPNQALDALRVAIYKAFPVTALDHQASGTRLEWRTPTGHAAATHAISPNERIRGVS